MKNKRWRADKGEKFYYINDDFHAKYRNDHEDYFANSCYRCGNYFRTKKAAQKAAQEIAKVLKRSNDELCDFQWAIEKMKEGKRVTRKAYRMQKGFENDHLAMVNGVIMRHCLSEEYFYDSAEYIYISVEKDCDLFATDWEIYGGK